MACVWACRTIRRARVRRDSSSAISSRREPMPRPRSRRSTARRENWTVEPTHTRRHVASTRPSSTATRCRPSSSRPSSSSWGGTPCSRQKTSWRSAIAASSSASDAARRISTSPTVGVLPDVALELGVALVGTGVLVAQRARAVVEVGEREALRHADRGGDLLAWIEVGRVGERSAPQVAPGPCARVARVQPEERHPLAELYRYPLEHGELEAARRAPRRPLVQHDRMSPERGETALEAVLPAAHELVGLLVQPGEGGGRVREALLRLLRGWHGGALGSLVPGPATGRREGQEEHGDPAGLHRASLPKSTLASAPSGTSMETSTGRGDALALRPSV